MWYSIGARLCKRELPYISSFPESAEYVTNISAFFLLGCDMITLEREGSEWYGNCSIFNSNYYSVFVWV